MTEVNARHGLALAGRCAVVTGAGTRGRGVGIGRAIAVALARAGADVALIDREPDRVAETAAMIEAAGGTCCTIIADVSIEDDCRSAVENAVTNLGQINILVNNAAITDSGTPLQLTDSAGWEHVMAVNLTGAMLMSRLVVERFSEGSGVIINIASVSAMQATGALAYGASKAGMVNLTQNLAVALGARGVRVNAIAPGYIMTPMVLDALPERVRSENQRLVPLATEGTPWDIAEAAVFLASDRARFITGACLPVDGGTSAASLMSAPYLLSQ